MNTTTRPSVRLFAPLAACALLALSACASAPPPPVSAAGLSIDKVTVVTTDKSGATNRVADRLRDELSTRVRAGSGNPATLQVQVTDARGVAAGAIAGTSRVAAEVSVVSPAGKPLNRFQVEGSVQVGDAVLADPMRLEALQARTLADQIAASLYRP